MNISIKIIISRFLLAFFFLLGMINSFSQEIYEHQYLVKLGDEAPDFSIPLNDGRLFQLSQYKGQVVMLQFTASWCSVCRKEMPYIETEIWQELKDKGLVLVGVDYKEKQSVVNKFATDMKISYPLAIDSTGSVFHLFAAEGAGVTRNVIIDKTGRIIYLTRLFDKKEFDEMKSVIFREVESN